MVIIDTKYVNNYTTLNHENEYRTFIGKKCSIFVACFCHSFSRHSRVGWVSLAVHTLLPLMLQCLDPIGKKSHQQQIWRQPMNFSPNPRIGSVVSYYELWGYTLCNIGLTIKKISYLFEYIYFENVFSFQLKSNDFLRVSILRLSYVFLDLKTIH